MYILFISLFLITYTILSTPSTHAQQASPESDEQIPSDLSLDLNLAEQNPAPAQKQILQSQTPQAQITTSSGDSVVVSVKDTLPPEVKTQSAKETVSPDQTTSEQVVTTNVEEKTGTEGSDTSNTSSTTGNPSSTNTIPGTTIQEPDDNAAPPLPASSVSPTQTQPTPAGSDGNTNTSTDQSNTIIPPENGVAPAPAPAPDVGSSPKDSTAPAPVVQGVSIGPTVSWLRQLINKLLR